MPVVTYELQDHVALITLNRPEAMNTFNPDMYRAFNAATARFRDDDAAWVAVIAAAGDRAFSAGVDIKALDALAASADDPGALAQTFDIELEGEYFCDKPILAAIQGYCIGEGLSMALGCDLRIAGEGARFALPESRVGLPTINAAMHGARIMGTANALELLLLGEQRDAEWARRTGLVNRVVPDDQVLDETLAWARKIAALSPLANRITKDMAARGHSRGFAESAALGARRRDALLASHDAAEGRRAFLEKRAPKFIGA
ncbi:enoyl-CoA hydratase/isomerase family protein [Parahaliea mediterranea]|uniref:Enoyl-CoA hydratase/isomerase family protein n=1 Tax=Parahaliea mediterranea TaxID=651086 RepID=A0A939IM23_9GAMM|nr:enoyl-CoA hydratase/isomerase family protein [Parahaliea mediterranea]MBN7796562.1 enoyl-CoA hydratase/isomerase family protein [Parahaliea mediterranea]